MFILFINNTNSFFEYTATRAGVADRAYRAGDIYCIYPRWKMCSYLPFLDAMKHHPTMKISELKKTVGEMVEQLTNGLQKPTSRNEPIAVDWDIW